MPGRPASARPGEPLQHLSQLALEQRGRRGPPTGRAGRGRRRSPRPSRAVRWRAGAGPRASREPESRRPTAPRSSSANRPVSSTRTLPWCRSAWNTPVTMTCRSTLRSSRSAISWRRAGSMVASSGGGAGDRRPGHALHDDEPGGAQLAVGVRDDDAVAGVEVGGDRGVVDQLDGVVQLLVEALGEPLGDARMPSRRPHPVARCSQVASRMTMSRSAVTCARASGRCTLRTTGVPSRSVAAWTWATDAAASGFSSTRREDLRTAAVPARARRPRRRPATATSGRRTGAGTARGRTRVR